MKKLIYIYMVLGIMISTACSNKENATKKDDIRVLMQDSTDSHGLQRMQISKIEQTITFKGTEYHSSLLRMPGDSLPRVKSEMGDTFIDNEITLKITRGNVHVFSKTFTKQSFSSLIGAEFMKKSILEGMVFDKTTSQGMVYAVSVSYPQTDLYIPISVTITADGKMSMEKEELMEEVYTPNDKS